MYVTHHSTGMHYIMIYLSENDVFYMDVFCCSNSSASLNSDDEQAFLKAVIDLNLLKNFR